MVTPDDLLFGRSAIHAIARMYDLPEPSAPAAQPPVKRNHNKKKGTPPRLYKSRYVGVTEHRNRWIAQWGPRGAVKSRVYPFTPEGERDAAWERARALGLAEPEVRDAAAVMQPEASHAPKIPARPRRKLGGERIA